MTLVDTSVWIDHLRNGNAKLQNLLHDGEVQTHPFIVGELSCGNLKNREEILRLLSNLAQLEVAEHAEVLKLIESKKLFGRGIGWIDVHLLAAAMISHDSFWTLDKRLAAVATHLRIAKPN